jgi:hypothetical protein
VKRVIGFPPGSHFVVLPSRPTRAALAGLALYDATLFHQRTAARVVRLLLDIGLGSLLRNPDSQYQPEDWWQELIEQVAEPVLGPVSRTAFLLPGDRIDALLMDQAGQPLGFIKVRWQDLESYRKELAGQLLERLAGSPPVSFRVPRLLAQGELNGIHYRLLEPLPEGPHRRPPRDPERISEVVEELQGKLDDAVSHTGMAPHHVPLHGDFTPRNLRLAADGRLWLFDWEHAGYGPRLADELRYWCSDLSLRFRPRAEPAAKWIVRVLRTRGTNDEILEAVEWPEFNLPREQAMRDHVGILVGDEGGRGRSHSG